MKAIITKENVHIWDKLNPFTDKPIYADIPNIGLVDFADKDECINFLYVNGFKQSACELNNN